MRPLSLSLFALLAALCASGCSQPTPCAKLAKAICSGGDRAGCARFVDRQMVSSDGALREAHKQSACVIVLDDEATVQAMRAAYTAAKAP